MNEKQEFRLLLSWQEVDHFPLTSVPAAWPQTWYAHKRRMAEKEDESPGFWQEGIER